MTYHLGDNMETLNTAIFGEVIRGFKDSFNKTSNNAPCFGVDHSYSNRLASLSTTCCITRHLLAAGMMPHFNIFPPINPNNQRTLEKEKIGDALAV